MRGIGRPTSGRAGDVSLTDNHQQHNPSKDDNVRRDKDQTGASNVCDARSRRCS